MLQSQEEEVPDKRHSWAWPGCGPCDKVSKALLEGVSVPTTSCSVEVLDTDIPPGKGFELMIMAPQWEEKETRFSLDPTLAPGGDSELYKISVSEGTSFLSNSGPEASNLLEKEAAGYEWQEGGAREQGGLSGLQIIREVGRTVLLVGLLVGEGATWTSLYSGPRGLAGAQTEYREYILLFLLLPTLANCGAWLAGSWCDKGGSVSCPQASSVFLLLLLSVPSPVLLHLFYLYEVTRGGGRTHQIHRLLIYCQLGHALTGSLPLLLTGLYMLLQEMRTAENTIAINHLPEFVDRYPVFLPGLLLSLLLLLTSTHRYNERRTSSLLSVLVTLPFTLTTLLVRTLALALIIAFQPLDWVLLLLAGLVTLHLGAGVALTCRGSATPARGEKGVGTDKAGGGGEPDMLDCWASGRCSGLVSGLPGQLTRSFAGVLVPLGYDNDWELGQARVRGGLLIWANYALSMGVLGAGLGLTLFYRMPSTLQGLEMAQMEVQVVVPETNLVVKAMSGVDIQVKLPSTKVDLAGASNHSVSMMLAPWVSLALAVSLPLLLILVSLPPTITRAAMLGLDCVAIRQDRERGQTRDREGGLPRLRLGLGRRVSVSLACGLLGAVLSSVGILVVVIVMAVKLAS